MSCVKIEVAVLGSPVPNSPYGLCGGKATLNSKRGYLGVGPSLQPVAALRLQHSKRTLSCPIVIMLLLRDDPLVSSAGRIHMRTAKRISALHCS